jgi:glycosyltransferase involved in cell wall biosynthesis/O-antigen/teichoic acid export membrane protein
MIGCAKRGHYELIKYVFFVPFYWIAISVAAVKALYQLIVKPHFWEKTHHGLHLKPETKSVRVGIERFSKLKNLTQTKLFNNTSLVISSIIVNFVNFLYNTYLSRSSKVSLADFGTIGLLGSFAFILQIPQTALFSTVSYRSAYLLGKYGSINKTFWQHTRKTIVKISIITTLIWIGTSPFLASVFGSDTYLPFLIFSPLITISFISAIDSGFIQGSNRFVAIAIISILESISKLIITIFLVQQNWINLVYISIPISAGIYLITSWIFALRLSQQDNNSETDNVKYFPKKYFISSLTIKLSTLSFLGLDLILAKAYLTPSQAGLYTLVSLVGKLIFSVSSIFSQFITPIISKAEGAGDNSKNIFYKILVIATISSLLIATTFSLNNSTLSVLLFGKKIVPVIHLIPIFSIGVILFTITNNIVNYHQIKHQYIFSFISLLISSIQILLLSKANNNLELFVSTVVWVNIFNFILVIFLHLLYPRIGQIVNGEHITYLIDKILQNKNNQIITPNLRILIFNWRDTKHVWAGGAEVYVHELAKNWVKFGHQVTIFCGNDYKCSNYEIIDGVKIYRKGGFFTVYLWAAIYYLIKFRGKFDVIVDSENGIPFFTPLYSRIPKFLLIHHVHQNVFREQLPFPLAQIAMFLESKVMPFLYRGQKIITVSNSSRNDIIRLKIGKKENISIVNPGINPTSFHKSPKSRTPNFIYLGRLRPYKNIDIAIKSVAKLIKKYPNLKLNIAGWGENIDELKKLSHKLEIEKSVIFLEKVSEKDKINLLGKSWAMIQPSSFEGWGITVIEANACGTPVIASNVVGLRDSVINKKTGLLVQVKNIDQLSKTIEKLIKNKKIRQELSSQALLWANRFNWEEKSREFLNIITDSLSKEYSFKCDLALVEND